MDAKRRLMKAHVVALVLDAGDVRTPPLVTLSVDGWDGGWDGFIGRLGYGGWPDFGRQMHSEAVGDGAGQMGGAGGEGAGRDCE